jgi:hypothetical protein
MVNAKPEGVQMFKKLSPHDHNQSKSIHPRKEEIFSTFFKLEVLFFNNLIKTNLSQQLMNYNQSFKY